MIHNDRVLSRGAILILVETSMPFRVFKTQNFVPTQIKLVVTAADTENRIVHELNAEPAAREYASAIGLLPDDLGPFSFASYPLVVKVGGDYYCRSIRNMNPDGSLSFFCAIDEGLVFTVARPQDICARPRRNSPRSTASSVASISSLASIACCAGSTPKTARSGTRWTIFTSAIGRGLPHLRRAVQRHAPEPDADWHRLRPPGFVVTPKDLRKRASSAPPSGGRIRAAHHQARQDQRRLDAARRALDGAAGQRFLAVPNGHRPRGQVRIRTEELKNALDRLEQTNDELVIARDASDRANRVKTRFFTAVGHDLLQPLHAARLSLSALGGGRPAGTNTRLIGQIDNALDSIEELLKTILDLSKLEAGALTPALQAVPLTSLFHALISDIEPIAREKGLILTMRDTSAAVTSDPLMLRRMLQNLLVNAVRYSERGEVKLGGKAPGRGDPRRGVGHRPRHRGQRAEAHLRGVPARGGLREGGRRRLRVGTVDRAAHGRHAGAPG